MYMFMLSSLCHHQRHHNWQNSSFWAIAFLRRFCQIAAGFHSFGFRDNNFYFYGARSSALRPKPNPEEQVSVFTSSSERVAQLCPLVMLVYNLRPVASCGPCPTLLTRRPPDQAAPFPGPWCLFGPFIPWVAPSRHAPISCNSNIIIIMVRVDRWVRSGMHVGYWWGSQKERDHYEDQDVSGWRDNVKMNLGEIGWGGMDWIDMA
jgi:hypothetical protein